MEQYFEQQASYEKLFFMEDIDLGVNPDGSKNKKLQVLSITKDELLDLPKTHKFVRMTAGSVLPVLEKINKE